MTHALGGLALLSLGLRSGPDSCPTASSWPRAAFRSSGVGGSPCCPPPCTLACAQTGPECL